MTENRLSRPSAAAFGTGCALLLCLPLRCAVLDQGTLPVRLGVGAVLVLLALLSLLLLRREGYGRRVLLPLLLPIALALLLRALALDHITYDYRDFLSQWAAFFRERGGFAAIREPVGDYNVPYLYFVAAISYLPVPDLYAIKLFSILFDVILAWGGLRLVRALGGNGKQSIAAFLMLLFLPTVVLNGSLWGQCDSLYGALVLHALATVADGKPKTSVALLAAAFSFKLPDHLPHPPMGCAVAGPTDQILSSSGLFPRLPGRHSPRPAAGKAPGRHSGRLLQTGRRVQSRPGLQRPQCVCPSPL